MRRSVFVSSFGFGFGFEKDAAPEGAALGWLDVTALLSHPVIKVVSVCFRLCEEFGHHSFLHRVKVVPEKVVGFGSFCGHRFAPCFVCVSHALVIV